MLLFTGEQLGVVYCQFFLDGFTQVLHDLNAPWACISVAFTNTAGKFVGEFTRESGEIAIRGWSASAAQEPPETLGLSAILNWAERYFASNDAGDVSAYQRLEAQAAIQTRRDFFAKESPQGFQ